MLRKLLRLLGWGHDASDDRPTPPPPNEMPLETPRMVPMMDDATQIATGLRAVHDRAGHGQQSLMIHLFGIRYANEIKQTRVRASELMVLAGLPKLGPTLNSGVRMAPYVTLTPEAVRLLERLVKE